MSFRDGEELVELDLDLGLAVVSPSSLGARMLVEPEFELFV